MSNLQTQPYLYDIKMCSVEDVASVASLLFLKSLLPVKMHIKTMAPLFPDPSEP